MNIALTIFLIAGPIGLIDVLYYHIYKFRLYERPASFGEQLTHLARGVLFPFTLWMLIAGEPHGGWALALIGVFVVDFFVSAADLWLEPQSRAAEGGVPRSELMIHYLGATAMTAGAVFAISDAVQWVSLPTELALRATTSSFTQMITWGGIIAATALNLLEAGLFVCAQYACKRSSSKAVEVGLSLL